jgi:hypothetical protein
VPRLGQERQRRRLAEHEPHRQLVRRLGHEVTVELEHLLGVRERVHDQAGKHLGADLVDLELERRHHAEVAAAAADGPEQVAVLVRVGGELVACGRDHRGRDEVVDREPVLAAEPAEAAAEREAGDAGR